MLQFKATDEQVQEICVKAVEASQPVGGGFIHYSDKQKFKREMFTLRKDKPYGGVSLDYVGGRMVKLNILFVEEGVWKTDIHDRGVDLEYQSWGRQYKTYQDLLRAAGIEVQNATP